VKWPKEMDGQEGVFTDSEPVRKDTKPIGTVVGDFAESHTEF
jgi:hypothetical protein